jgi:hypothetical protein
LRSLAQHAETTREFGFTEGAASLEVQVILNRPASLTSDLA